MITDTVRDAFEKEWPKPSTCEYNSVGNYYASVSVIANPLDSCYQYRWQGYQQGWQASRAVPVVLAEQLKTIAKENNMYRFTATESRGDGYENWSVTVADFHKLAELFNAALLAQGFTLMEGKQ